MLDSGPPNSSNLVSVGMLLIVPKPKMCAVMFWIHLTVARNIKRQGNVCVCFKQRLNTSFWWTCKAAKGGVVGKHTAPLTLPDSTCWVLQSTNKITSAFKAALGSVFRDVERRASRTTDKTEDRDFWSRYSGDSGQLCAWKHHLRKDATA